MEAAIEPEKPAFCPQCGGVLSAGDGTMPGAAFAEQPAQAMQAEPPPYPAQNMPCAGMPRFAGDIHPEAERRNQEKRRYLRNKRIWKAGLVLWLLLFSASWAFTMGRRNENLSYMILMMGAAVLGAFFPIDPEHPGVPALQKISAFTLVLLCGGFCGFLLGRFFHYLIHSYML
jgi:hypothetical protein